jgi:hypothetical protein
VPIGIENRHGEKHRKQKDDAGVDPSPAIAESERDRSEASRKESDEKLSGRRTDQHADSQDDRREPGQRFCGNVVQGHVDTPMEATTAPLKHSGTTSGGKRIFYNRSHFARFLTLVKGKQGQVA